MANARPNPFAAGKSLPVEVKEDEAPKQKKAKRTRRRTTSTARDAQQTNDSSHEVHEPFSASKRFAPTFGDRVNANVLARLRSMITENTKPIEGDQPNA